MKPAMGGVPARLNTAMRADVATTGIFFARPLIFRMSRVPIWVIITPATINSSPLPRAWANM